MTNTTTKEYLEKVFTLELSCYELENYLQNLRRQLKIVKNPSFYKLEDESRPVNRSWGLGLGCLIGIGVAIATSVVLYIALGIYELVFGLFKGSFFIWLTTQNGEMKLLIGVAAIAFLIPVIMCLYASISVAQENSQANEKARLSNKKYVETNKQIREQSQKQAELLMNEISNADDMLKKTENTKVTYYSMEIIYEKYRGLIPVAMFNEYFASGRCTTLPQAYDRYEQEIRLDMIITKLDDIIDRLDRIEGNQYMLAESIRDVNQSVQRLTSIAEKQTHQLQEISRNQEITNYYERMTAINTSYMAWITFNRK